MSLNPVDVQRYASRKQRDYRLDAAQYRQDKALGLPTVNRAHLGVALIAIIAFIAVAGRFIFA